MQFHRFRIWTTAGFQLFEPSFKVLTAYENTAARSRARNVRLQLENQCDDELHISRVSWCFSLLRNENLRRHAAIEAAVADMIIICLQEDRLPGHVESWIASWPCRLQSTPAALVAVLDPVATGWDGRGRLASYFQEVARNQGLDFFCNVDGWRHHSPRTVVPEHRKNICPPVSDCLAALWRRVSKRVSNN